MPPKPLPPQLFKYAKWAHSEELIRWGKIRVGTLFDYKNIERHVSGGTGDKEEGMKRLFETTGAETGETLSGFAAGIVSRVIGPGFVGPGAGTVGFFNSMFVERHRSPNFWLYCTSDHLSFRVMDSFRANYDTCVRITHVWEFFVGIAHELTRRASSMAVVSSLAPTATGASTISRTMGSHPWR